MISCCVFVVRRWQVPPLRLPRLVAPVPVPEIAGTTGNAAVAMAPAVVVTEVYFRGIIPKWP
jgi:hypothetical protein